MAEEKYVAGLEGIVAGETAISDIRGALRYRGYAVEDLALQASFEQVAYLLLHGALPTADELKTFCKRLKQNAGLAEPIVRFIGQIPKNAPLMDVLRTGVSAAAHWDKQTGDNSREANLAKAERLLAQIPVILAARHRMAQDKEPVAADGNLGFAENILWMVFRKRPHERIRKALDATLILYAEHEFNASTFTARVVCSTLSDLHSAVTGAIGALKGPLHGGANELVIDLLKNVGSAEKAEAWVKESLQKKSRVMGFGHRVYKNGDPRAEFLKAHCREVAELTDNTKWENIADAVEREMAKQKGLRPNLDWPTARLYHYLGLPVELYTPLFVASRLTGWCAHILEQFSDNRLIRPRSKYVGPEPRTLPSSSPSAASESQAPSKH